MSGSVDASGSYALTIPNPLTEGAYAMDITSTDAAFNESVAMPIIFTIDTTPPAIPSISSFRNPV